MSTPTYDATEGRELAVGIGRDSARRMGRYATRGAVTLVISLLLAGCAAPAATQDAPVALAPLPDPIHDERAFTGAVGPRVASEAECLPIRPCVDYPITLARPALVKVDVTWSSPDTTYVDLEILTGDARVGFAASADGATSVSLHRILVVGEHVIRLHVRMNDDRYVLDAVFTEPPAPAGPACDASRPAVAHAGGARLVASPLPPPVPCAYFLPSTTVEPTIGLHPETGAVFYYPTSSAPEGTLARSLDEGATWEFLQTNLDGTNTHPISADPYLYLDPATGRLFVDDLMGTCSMISWSDDMGESWEHTPVGGCLGGDHQTLFAGPPVTSPTLEYPNVVYRCAANTGRGTFTSTTATCQRSLDGGRSWLAPGEPAYIPRPTGRGNNGIPGWCDGLVGHGAVGADGTVYLPKGWCDEPWLAISHDEGLTWSRTLVADNGFLRGIGFQAHDAGVGIDAEGNVYYGWVAADRMPYVAVSRDGGATFESPRMVAPPGVNEASHPELIAGAAGAIAFLYLGTTNSPGDFSSDDCVSDPTPCVLPVEERPDHSNTTWNAYVTTSLDAASAEPTYWTLTINDPADPLVRGACGEVRCGAGHDFFDIRIGPDGSAWVALGDSCIDACVDDPKAPGGNRAMVGRVVGFGVVPQKDAEKAWPAGHAGLDLGASTEAAS